MNAMGLNLILLVCASPLAGGELVLVQDSPEARDLTLSVYGQQALSAVPEFREGGIFVRVRTGIAELRGQVGSDEQSRRAERLVRDVSGIVGVRNYLEVRARREPAVLNIDPEPPSSARAASPNLATLPEIPLSIGGGVGSATTPPPPPRREPVVPKPPEVVPEVTIETKPAPPPPAPFRIDLGTPSFAAEPVRPPPVAAPMVLAAPVPTRPVAVTVSGLDAILGEPQFREIKVEQRGSAVVIHQYPGQGAKVMALARRLQNVPEVEEIVLVPAGR